MNTFANTDLDSMNFVKAQIESSFGHGKVEVMDRHRFNNKFFSISMVGGTWSLEDLKGNWNELSSSSVKTLALGVAYLTKIQVGELVCMAYLMCDGQDLEIQYLTLH